MAHPDWLGRQPEAAFWGYDSNTVYYQRKQQGSELRDWFAQPVASSNQPQQLSLQQWDDIGEQQQIFSADGQYVAWTFEGQVMVRQLSSGLTSQITRNHKVHQGLHVPAGWPAEFSPGLGFLCR